MPKSKTDTEEQDIRKRRQIRNISALPKLPPPPIKGKLAHLRSCPGYTPPTNNPSSSALIRHWPLLGYAPLASLPLPWVPTYSGVIGATFNEVAINITVDGFDPAWGDWVELGPTVPVEDSLTGIITTVAIPQSSQGSYMVRPWGPAISGPLYNIPLPTLTMHTTSHPNSPYGPCDCGGKGIVAKKCSNGVIHYGFEPSTPLGTTISGHWYPSWAKRIKVIPIGGTIATAQDPVVGQWIEYNSAGIPGDICSPPHNPGNTTNYPSGNKAGIYEILAVNPNTTPLHNYHVGPAPSPLDVIPGHYILVYLQEVPPAPPCGPIPLCDPVAFAALPYAYYTFWPHDPSLFYYPPVVLPSWWAPAGYPSPSSGGPGIPTGSPMYNPTSNFDYANQSTLCEWCADWQATGSVPGTFNPQVLNWHATWTLTMAEDLCSCCPGPPGGPALPPPIGTTVYPPNATTQ